MRQVLCPFVSLLTPLLAGETARLINDPLPSEVIFGGAPTWAYDMFVREGRQAMKAFLCRDNETAHWIREHAPPSERINLLGNILFAVEGGLLQSRLNWETGLSLRGMAEHESQGVRCPDGAALIEMMRAELPLLNEIRAGIASAA
ncbi:hypothetical protein SAMN02799622_05733 [Methylobacterium sp. UNC378MF]|nr:hypothetical protein SAMN02799622_05733 [Methylobacterium sp. UNC378MF]